MKSDRQIIVDQILQAIENGDLPREEIERRLNEILNAELNVPIGTKVNQEKVDLCNSLLWQLTTHGVVDFSSERMEKSKVEVEKKYLRYKKRQKTFTYAARSVAAVLIITFLLSVLNVFPSIRWFSHSSTEDGQQYVITGHEISVQAIANAIASHEEQGSLTTDSYDELTSYLGFDVVFPDQIGDFYPGTYYVSIMPESITVVCTYHSMIINQASASVRYQSTMFSDLESAYIQYEQDRAGDEIKVQGLSVYKSYNMDKANYFWIRGSALYRISVDPDTIPEKIIFDEISK